MMKPSGLQQSHQRNQFINSVKRSIQESSPEYESEVKIQKVANVLKPKIQKQIKEQVLLFKHQQQKVGDTEEDIFDCENLVVAQNTPAENQQTYQRKHTTNSTAVNYQRIEATVASVQNPYPLSSRSGDIGIKSTGIQVPLTSRGAAATSNPVFFGSKDGNTNSSTSILEFTSQKNNQMRNKIVLGATSQNAVTHQLQQHHHHQQNLADVERIATAYDVDSNMVKILDSPYNNILSKSVTSGVNSEECNLYSQTTPRDPMAIHSHRDEAKENDESLSVNLQINMPVPNNQAFTPRKNDGFNIPQTSRSHQRNDGVKMLPGTSNSVNCMSQLTYDQKQIGSQWRGGAGGDNGGEKYILLSHESQGQSSILTPKMEDAPFMKRQSPKGKLAQNITLIQKKMQQSQPKQALNHHQQQRPLSSKIVSIIKGSSQKRQQVSPQSKHKFHFPNDEQKKPPEHQSKQSMSNKNITTSRKKSAANVQRGGGSHITNEITKKYTEEEKHQLIDRLLGRERSREKSSQMRALAAQADIPLFKDFAQAGKRNHSKDLKINEKEMTLLSYKPSHDFGNSSSILDQSNQFLLNIDIQNAVQNNKYTDQTGSQAIAKKEIFDEENVSDDIQSPSGEMKETLMSFGRQSLQHSRGSSTVSRKNRSRDFKAEYLKLQESLITQQNALNNLGSMMLISDQDIQSFHKRILSQVRRVSITGKQSIFDNLYDQKLKSSQRYEQFKRHVEKEREQKLQESCTFQPDISCSSASKWKVRSPASDHQRSPRSPSQFFDDQMDFKRMIDDKVNFLKEKLITEELLKIRDLQNLMVERRERSEAKRLRDKLKRQSIIMLEEAQGLNSSKSRQGHYKGGLFGNRLNKSMEESKVGKRKLDIDRITKLYNDAKRIQEGFTKVRETQSHERKSSFERAHRRESQSPKCEDLLSSKIIKELKGAFLHLGICPEADHLNYLQMVMVLQHLNFINKNKASDVENTLIVEAWNSLKSTITTREASNSKEGISFTNLCVFIHAINNIALKQKLDDNFDDESQLYESRPFGQITKKGRFSLSSSQISQIHQKFKPFLHNKKYLESVVHRSHKESLLIEELDRFNFMPQVNEKSRTIAETRFKQINEALRDQRLKADYWDLMIKKGEIYKDNIQRAKKQQIETELKECTFMPELNTSRNERKNSQSKVRALILTSRKDYRPKEIDAENNNTRQVTEVPASLSPKIVCEGDYKEDILSNFLQVHSTKHLDVKSCDNNPLSDNTPNSILSPKHSQPMNVLLESPKRYVKKHKFQLSSSPKPNHSSKMNEVTHNRDAVSPSQQRKNIIHNFKQQSFSSMSHHHVEFDVKNSYNPSAQNIMVLRNSVEEAAEDAVAEGNIGNQIMENRRKRSKRDIGGDADYQLLGPYAAAVAAETSLLNETANFQN